MATAWIAIIPRTVLVFERTLGSDRATQDVEE